MRYVMILVGLLLAGLWVDGVRWPGLVCLGLLLALFGYLWTSALLRRRRASLPADRRADHPDYDESWRP